MGKGRRLKNLKQNGNPFKIIKNEKVDTNSDSFNHIFLGRDNELLTDELISELVKKEGMSEKNLRYFQKQGAQYCRPRNSFIFPPEIGSIWQNK